MAADATRFEVRKNALGYVVATAVTSVAVVLGAGTLQIFAVSLITFAATRIAAQAIVTWRFPDTRQGGLEKWTVAAVLGGYVGLYLGTLWFPWYAYLGEFLSDGRVEIPANVARTIILALALGLSMWVVILVLRPERYSALARFETLGSGGPRREIAPGEGGDIGLFALAMGSVLVLPMSAMDELTAPFSWPSVQIAVAFLLILPLVKRRSLNGALMVYRITFVAFALLLVRLAIGTAPALTIAERAFIGLAFVGVLAVSVLGHIRTTRLRDLNPSEELRSGVVP